MMFHKALAWPDGRYLPSPEVYGLRRYDAEPVAKDSGLVPWIVGREDEAAAEQEVERLFRAWLKHKPERELAGVEARVVDAIEVSTV